MNTTRHRRLGITVLLGLASAAFLAPAAARAGDEEDAPGACHPRPQGTPPPGCAKSIQGVVRDIAPLDAETLPDLTPLAPFYVEVGGEPTGDGAALPVNIVLGRPPDETGFLRFTTAIMNRGEFALDLLGVPTADPERAEAHQCVTWEHERACRQRVPAGDMAFHAAHNHFHFDDFAAYELRSLLSDGTPDFSPAGLLVTSPKVSFCLQDSRRERDDSSDRFYQFCLGALQGVSAGWSDLYTPELVGQALPLEGIPDGRYALVFVVDPSDRLHETDETNNLAWATVELSDDATQARIVSS